MYRNKRGFTLIELIIVVIIIGILAAIAAPMMQGNVNRAKASEALAAMGAIRTAERLYYVDQNSYIVISGNLDGTALNSYLKNADVLGTYFSVGDYSVSSSNVIKASGNTSNVATKCKEVNGFVINMDLVTGAITNSGY